jgi:hypothetical protein
MDWSRFLSPEVRAILERDEREKKAAEDEWYEQRRRERERQAARLTSRPTDEQERAAMLEKHMARRYMFETGVPIEKGHER